MFRVTSSEDWEGKQVVQSSLVSSCLSAFSCVFIAFLFPVLPLIRTPVILVRADQVLVFCISPLIRHTRGRFEAAIAQLLEYLPGIREALS